MPLAALRGTGRERGPHSPYAPITTAHVGSNVRERPRGGRYFIYRPPRTVDEIPSTLASDRAIGDTAAPHRRPGLRCLVSLVQNCSRRVPACHGHGAVVVSTAWTPSRRRAQFDGRQLWACTGGRLGPLGGWRTRFAEGAAAGRPCQACAAWRRAVDLESAARQEEPHRHGEHSVAVCQGTKLGASSPPTEEVRTSRLRTAAAQPERLRRRDA